MHIGTSSKNLAFVDNCLLDQIGHYFHYAYSLYQFASARGFDVHVMGLRDVYPEVTNIMPVEPVFKHSFHHRFETRRFVNVHRMETYYDFIRANVEFLTEIKRALRRKVNKSSVVFMPMVNHRQLLAWAWWLRSQGAQDCPELVLMFRLTYFDVDSRKGWLPSTRLARFGFRTLERFCRGRAIRIVTDSHRLQNEYSQLTRLPVEVLPIPHTEEASRVRPGPNLTPTCLRFVALGDAREEKGFPILVEAIRRLGNAGALDGSLFVLQCHIGSTHHDEMKRYRRVLEEMALPGVQMIAQPLDSNAYYELLRSAHVVVLPYRRGTYYSRTSGPFVEALAAAKPVIVTHDTWMSDELRFGAGLTFEDGNSSDLACAIVQAKHRYSELATQAIAKREAWISFHNSRTFGEILFKEYGHTESRPKSNTSSS